MRMFTAEEYARRFFRCEPLSATIISVAQCRTNREMQPNGRTVPSSGGSTMILRRPMACNDCELAKNLEAGEVLTFSIEETIDAITEKIKVV